MLNLQRTYAQYAQAGLWTELGALFTPDGSFVFDGLIKSEQTSKGPVAIAGFLRTRYGGGYEGLKADGLSTMMIDAPVANLALLKSPFLLQQLMLRAALGTLLGHGFSAPLALADPPNVGTLARGAPPRNPGLAAPS